MDIFGNTAPREMPKHLFWGTISMDYSTAIEGDPAQQNYSVCPRHWYVDASFRCSKCGQEFIWTAGEQKVWFEEYYFWIDFVPHHCKKCMKDRRRLVDVRKEYDVNIARARETEDVGMKRRIVEQTVAIRSLADHIVTGVATGEEEKAFREFCESLD